MCLHPQMPQRSVSTGKYDHLVKNSDDQSTAEKSTPVFGSGISNFQTNRDCIFVPITSQNASLPSQPFGPTFHMPHLHNHDTNHYSHHHFMHDSAKQHNSDAGSSIDSNHDDDFVIHQTTSVCGISLRSIDGVSATLSFIFFVIACGYASKKGQYVDLWEQVLIVHNSTQVEHISNSFAVQMQQWCQDLPHIPEGCGRKTGICYGYLSSKVE